MQLKRHAILHYGFVQFVLRAQGITGRGKTIGADNLGPVISRYRGDDHYEPRSDEPDPAFPSWFWRKFAPMGCFAHASNIRSNQLRATPISLGQQALCRAKSPQREAFLELTCGLVFGQIGATSRKL